MLQFIKWVQMNFDWSNIINKFVCKYQYISKKNSEKDMQYFVKKFLEMCRFERRNLYMPIFPRNTSIIACYSMKGHTRTLRPMT